MDQQQIAGLIAGSRNSEAWYHNSDKVDFYDIQAHMDALFALHDGGQPTYERSTYAFLHLGLSADVCVDGKFVGLLGELDPQLAQTLGVN